MTEHITELCDAQEKRLPFLLPEQGHYGKNLANLVKVSNATKTSQVNLRWYQNGANITRIHDNFIPPKKKKVA